jgi:PAS domain S-box-containing protein
MRKKIKILIVENDTSDLEMMYRVLKKSGLSYVFETVEEEQNYLKAIEELVPDIILSAYSLPSFSGMRAFELRQAVTPNTPFIFVSGTIGEEKSIELIKKGVTDYVLKHKIFSLQQKIERALAENEDRVSKRIAELTIEFERNNLKALINNTHEIMWSVDRSFNLITSNNGFDEMVKKIAGKSISPGTGRNLKVSNNNILKRFKAYYERAFLGEIFTEIEYVSSPVESWAEISFYPISSGNKIVGTACHSRDITNIKKAERQIKANEQRFRAFVESGADTVAILSAKGKPLFVSSAIEKVLGYTEAEALQLNLFSKFHKDDIVWIIELWHQVLANPGIQFHVRPSRMMHKDGNWRWLEGTLTNLLDNDAVNGIVDNFRDVTDKKIAEDLLKLTQFAVDNSGDSVFWMSPDARIVDVNDAACNKLGYTKQEFLELTMHDIDPSCTIDIWNNNYNELREKKSIFCERTHKTKNGQIIPIEIRANYFQFQGKEYNCAFTRDITDRKKAELELKKSDEFSKEILNSLNFCIAVLNKNGEVIKTNQAWKIMSVSTKMAEANFISEGNNFLDTLKNAAIAGNMVAKDTLVGLKDVMNGRLSIYKNQYYFKPTINNEKWWFDIAISGFISQSDMVIINIQDITDLKNTERERDNTQEANTKLQQIELELSNALAKEKDLNELKSRFVSMASHEFRTPLTTIMSSLSLVSIYAENKDTDSQVKHINKIKKSVDNLTDILNDFLSASKLEEGKIENDPKEINLKSFIGDIVSEMQSITTKGITIVEKYQAKEIAIIDQKLLKNILFNLLSNAIKFSKASGIIEVIVEEIEGSITIAVKDYGIGISTEDQRHVFQRFFRGQNVTHIQGTGLGLNIVAKYTELMKASLTYESIENKGSIFSLKIPQ